MIDRHTILVFIKESTDCIRSSETSPLDKHDFFIQWESAVAKHLYESEPVSFSAKWANFDFPDRVVLQEMNRSSWLQHEESVRRAFNIRNEWLTELIGDDPDSIHSHSIPKSTKKSVFIVHGHNEAKKEATARLIEGLGLDAIILHEQTNKGRHTREKLLDHARTAAYAVILLTADDKGGTKDTDPEALQLRARQNVVLELGLFLGLLGPDRICVLYEEDVEVPSDYHGVVYEPLDTAGAWKTKLKNELVDAGMPVDKEKAARI